MKNTKSLLSLLLLLFISTGIIAQSLYQKGTLQTKKGKTVEAYIQIDFEYPQRFQQNITYITPKDYEKYQKSGKIKGSMKNKLNPSDLEGFILDNGQVFKTVRYADVTGKAIKMIPKKMCLEQISDGKILMYKLYSRTTGRINHELADMIFENRPELIKYIQDNFQLLILKDKKNPTNVMHINLLNYIGDNAKVKENYNNNKYVNKEYEAAFLRMVNDYNNAAIN